VPKYIFCLNWWKNRLNSAFGSSCFAPSWNLICFRPCLSIPFFFSDLNLSLRTCGSRLPNVAYENLSAGIISLVLRYTSSSFWFPSNVIGPNLIVPPSS